jgi:hypothetical protein
MTVPPAPAVALRVSPFEAVGEAIEYTKRSLFPFRFDRWLALGFVAFLDQCGRGSGGASGGGNGNWGGGGGAGDHGGPDVRAVTDWLGSHAVLVVGITAVVLTLIVALIAFVTWLNSRGAFMYLDNVATGRADVVRPWHEHAERAHSLFAWRFVLGVATLMGVVVLGGLTAFLVLAYAKGRLAGFVALAVGLLVLLPILLVVLVASGLVSVALRDFVAPLQWRLGVSCGEAAGVLWPLVRAHPGSFVVYIGLKIAFGATAAIVVLAAGCLTCCCAFLPVVSQTLLQPLFYFERTWSLVFLRQLGHDVFAISTPEPVAE